MIIGYGTPLCSIAGPLHLAEGEAAVLKNAKDRYVVVARIAFADWPKLIAETAKVEARR